MMHMAARATLRSRIRGWAISLFPAYFGTGARIVALADDWREVWVKLPLTLRTRNYVGTIFGGSMYGAVDPIYMVMLIKNLGLRYTVWDKSATIRFKRSGRSTLYAHFVLDDAELGAIRAELEPARSVEHVYSVDLADGNGVVHATIEKTIYIRRKDAVAPHVETVLQVANQSGE